MKEIYDMHDVMVVPSYRETFGLVYIEAMSRGLPVVFSRRQGIDGYFPEDTIGVAVDPTDPQSIADGVQRCLENKSRYSLEARRQSFKFDWKNISKELISLYQV